MLLRDAVSSVPDRSFARRVAIATGITTAIAVGGAIAVTLTSTPGASAGPRTPTLAIASVRAPSAAVAIPAELAFAKVELRAYAFEAFPMWASDNPGRACPLHLLEVNRYAPALHAVDPWGTPYQFLCGGAFGHVLHTRSAGPDRAYDTADDLSSQQP